MRDIHVIGAYFLRLFADAFWLKWPMAFGVGLIGYALPTETMQRAALAAIYLVFLDTITGMVAARKGDGQAITSAKFGRALVKLLAYFSVVSVAAVTTQEVPGLQVAQGASVSSILTLVILTESISILENVKRMGWNLRWFGRLLEAQLKEISAPSHAIVPDEALAGEKHKP